MKQKDFDVIAGIVRLSTAAEMLDRVFLLDETRSQRLRLAVAVLRELAQEQTDALNGRRP